MASRFLSGLSLFFLISTAAAQTTPIAPVDFQSPVAPVLKRLEKAASEVGVDAWLAGNYHLAPPPTEQPHLAIVTQTLTDLLAAVSGESKGLEANELQSVELGTDDRNTLKEVADALNSSVRILGRLTEPMLRASQIREYLSQLQPNSPEAAKILAKNPRVADFLKPYDPKDIPVKLQRLTEALIGLDDFLMSQVRAYRPTELRRISASNPPRPLEILESIYELTGSFDRADLKKEECGSLTGTNSHFLESVKAIIDPPKVPGGPLQGENPTFEFSHYIYPSRLDLPSMRSEVGNWQGEFLARLGPISAAVAELGNAHAAEELAIGPYWLADLQTAILIIDQAGSEIARQALHVMRTIPPVREKLVEERSDLLAECSPSSNAVYGLSLDLKRLGIEGAAREPVVMSKEETEAAQKAAADLYEQQTKKANAADTGQH